MKNCTLAELYQHLDQLVDNNQDENSDSGNIADILFASSYIRGFIALEAANFGDEQQMLSVNLANTVTEQLEKSRSELTPQDQQIVSNYWHQLKQQFTG
ncbi:YfcL family protein [Thalassotalea atypica]|uniref:YfcL family protein n=1 Tax=Thalassotalea atypica TaxID=2054316 RepID=UPI002572D44D|nr:YfcL family protein [Thalassotalea atypica]